MNFKNPCDTFQRSWAAIGVGAVSLVGGLIKNGQANKQKKLAAQVKVPDANYQNSIYAKAMLAQAQQLNNARMPGAAIAEQNIMGNNANTMASVERNATSGAQALSMATAAQGNTDNALNSLGQQEGQWKLNAINNMNTIGMQGANSTYEGQLRNQQIAIQQKNALGLAATQNQGNAWNEVANGALGALSIYNARKQGG